MNDERRTSRGQDIAERITKLGMSQRAFADKTKIDRTTVGRAIDGDPSVRGRTLDRIEAAIRELEVEMGFGAPDADGAGDRLEYSIAADAIGLNITVRGPISDREELEQSVLRIVREMGIKS